VVCTKNEVVLSSTTFPMLAILQVQDQGHLLTVEILKIILKKSKFLNKFKVCVKMCRSISQIMFNKNEDGGRKDYEFKSSKNMEMNS
jgi:hypothetical protein